MAQNGNNMKDSNVEKVIGQLREREARGLQKYGTNTDRPDLSTLEWLQHLQEELMDGCVYIEKLNQLSLTSAYAFSILFINSMC